MKLPLRVFFVLCLMGAGLDSAVLMAAEINVAPSARTDLQVTVYNGDLALIRDSRNVSLSPGDVDLAFAGVSTRLQPETALLRSADGAFMVKEQVFDFGVIDRQALLAASVGEEVTVVRINPDDGDEVEVRAEVLAVANGVVLKIGDRITTDIPGRLVFDSLPENLRSQPTLVAVIETLTPGDAVADLNYLTSGLTWRADYVAELGADGTTMDLSAWATIANTTGTNFTEATLKLVAGDINRAAPPQQLMRTMEMVQARTAAMAQDIAQESLAAYHLYTIDRPVTLADQQTKQLALLSAGRIEVQEDLVSRSDGFAIRSPLSGQARTSQAERSIVFKNTSEAGLGTPLPSGTVRVYGQDSTGSLQLIGEDGLTHTAVGQDVRFTLGRDFDVTVKREQTEFLRASDRITISAHRLMVNNAKDEAVSVRLVETLQGDWEFIAQSESHAVVQGGAEWIVNVPADGEVEVTYRVRVRF